MLYLELESNGEKDKKRIVTPSANAWEVEDSPSSRAEEYVIQGGEEGEYPGFLPTGKKSKYDN